MHLKNNFMQNVFLMCVLSKIYCAKLFPILQTCYCLQLYWKQCAYLCLPESTHLGWQRLPPNRWMWVFSVSGGQRLSCIVSTQSGHWWAESGGGRDGATCWCLRLRLKDAARLYSASKYDHPKAQADQLDAMVSSLVLVRCKVSNGAVCSQAFW